MPDAIPPAPEAPKIAVVIPSFQVKQHILGVLEKIGPECALIYVVDDACPEGSGAYVEAECKDPRVRVLKHEVNQGVGGATMTGYRAALEDGARILVKLDGDGQMDPTLIPRLIAPIVAGEADYAKGNRFFELEGLSSMPKYRLFGNSALSFMNKLSSGYWDIFDPTNGFTALHAAVATRLPWDQLSRRYFFESDLLFRLATLRAVVADVPMPAVYGDETSGIVLRHVVAEFAWGHLRNTFKRIFYNYYLRDFNIASIEILVGFAFVVFGVTFGAVRWIQSGETGIPSTTGTIMLAALPIILGTQLLLGFVTHDLSSMPRQVIHRRLEPPLPNR